MESGRSLTAGDPVRVLLAFTAAAGLSAAMVSFALRALHKAETPVA